VLSLPQSQPQPLLSLLLVPTRRKKRSKTRKKRRKREERDLENYREGRYCYRRRSCRRRNI
jgi:hypothetical protein